MQKIHLTTFIQAPREKVWDVMLSDATYREWTSVFCPGSYYQGDWKRGSSILFLGPGQNDEGESGMVSRIEENRPYEFISIEHLGIIKDGVTDTESEEVKKWKGVHENYTFNKKDGGTELVIDMDINEEEKEFMEKAWKEALVSLKKIAEKV